MINELKLELACGDRKEAGFVGIDVAKTTACDYVVDLQKYPWPIESNSAEIINCFHYIEHIPHNNYKSEVKEMMINSDSFDEFKWKVLNHVEEPDGFILFVNELYRILKPGGKVIIDVPYYTSFKAYGDPTHQRFMTEFSFSYLNKAWREQQKLEHYAFDCDFDAHFSYMITEEMTLKSEEVRQKMFTHNWNVIDNLRVEIIKRK